MHLHIKPMHPKTKLRFCYLLLTGHSQLSGGPLESQEERSWGSMNGVCDMCLCYQFMQLTCACTLLMADLDVPFPSYDGLFRACLTSDSTLLGPAHDGQFCLSGYLPSGQVFCLCLALLACQELSKQALRSLLAWSCSRTLWICTVTLPSGLVINSTGHLFPALISLVT